MIAVNSVADQAKIGRFVPKESLEGQTEANFGQPQGYKDFVWSLIDSVDQDNIQANVARHRKWLTNMRFFIGEQLGYINAAGAWNAIPRNPGDPIYVINLVQYFINALHKDYMRSQAIIDVTARGGRVDMRLASRPGSELLKLVRRDQWTPTAIDRDGKFCIILGNTFRYTTCQANAGQYRREPVTKKVNVEIGGSSYICLNPDCGHVGDLTGQMPEGEFQQGQDVGVQECEMCGGTEIDISRAPQYEAENVVGFEERQVPDISTAVVDPFEIKLPFHAEDVPTAEFLRRERFVDTSKIKAAFPWAVNLMDDTSAVNNGESALLMKREIEQSPGNVGGQVSGFGTTPNQNRLSRFRQYWFRPEAYRHWRFPEDTTMANGEVIPKGTPKIRLFPKGYYVAVSGRTILETADEDKAKCWVHNRWEVVPNAIWGMGAEQIVEGNQLYNEIFSLMYEFLMYETDPPIVLDPRYLHRSDWSGRPGSAAVLRQGAPAGGVGAAFAQPQPRQLGSATFGFLEILKGDFQLTSGGAFNTASGLPSTETDTARGMAIQRDQALQMHISRLKRKAESDVVTGTQELILIKKHNLAQFYYPRLSDFSQLELQMFDKCDVETDLEIVDRPQSFIPRSALETRNDLLEALTAGGLPLGIFNPAIPRHLRRFAIESFGLPFEAEFLAADERNALLRIHAILEMAPLLTMERPEVALAVAADVAPVRYRIDDHQIAIDTIIDFCKTDEGQNLDPMSELLINDLITRHKQGQQMKLMEDMASAEMMTAMMPGFGGSKPMRNGGPQNGFSDQQAASPRETEKTQRSGDAMY